MLSFPGNDKVGVIETFKSTIRHLDDLLNINISYFKQRVSKIYLTELLVHTEWHSFI